MDKKEKNVKKIIYNLAILIVTAVFMTCIFKIEYESVNCDKPFHYARLQELAEEIEVNGLKQYPYYINFNSYDGAGYPTEIFYGDAFLIPSALMINHGMSINMAYSLTILVSTILIFISMFFAYRYLNKDQDKDNALLVAFLYTFTNFILFELIERNALGTNFAYIFLPWVVVATLKIIHNEGNSKINTLVLGTSMAAMVISHLQTSLVAILGLAIYAILNIKSIWKNKKSMLQILSAGVIFLFLSSFYIAPMVEQMNFQKLYVTDNSSPYRRDSISTAVTNPLNILASNFVWDSWIPESHIFGNDSLINQIQRTWSTPAYYIAVIFLTLMLFNSTKIKENFKKINKKQNLGEKNNLVINFFNKERTTEEKIVVSTIVIMILVFLSIFTKFICNDKIFGFLQFPWRVLTIVCMFLPIGFIIKNKNNTTIKNIAFAITAIVAIEYFVTLNNFYFSDTFVNLDPIEQRVSVGRGEYLPSEVPSVNYNMVLNKKYRNSKDTFLDIKYKLNGYEFVLNDDTLNDNKENENIELPVIYYKGYEVYIYNEDKNEMEQIPIYKTENGTIGINRKAKNITVKYNKTKIQRFSRKITVISIIGVIGAFIIIVFLDRKDKKTKNK